MIKKVTSIVLNKIVLILSFICFNLHANAQNPIVLENALPGTPQVTWDAPDGDGIQGFATEFSVSKGETIDFKIDLPEVVTTDSFTVLIYRIGYYQGNGARLVADLGSFSGFAQQAPLYEASTGKYDCSNWLVSASWNVPATAVSGVYAARLQSSTDASLILFVVRDETSNSGFLFKTSDATWQAYNKYDGNTFYAAATPVPGYSHAVKVSYNRPMVLRGDKSGFFNAEYPMIRWMERNGYDISYTTDMDMSKDNTPIVPATGVPGTYSHKVLLSVGHDEYWSLEERTKFENARDSGVHLAFFSGNEVYWKVRWEDNFKTLVCYKEGVGGEYTCGGNCDPSNIWTGLWREGCDSSTAAVDGCNPEGSLTGQMSWTQSNGSLHVPYEFKDFRFWRNTAVANLNHGEFVEMPYGTLGNEWDPEQFTETYPDHRIKLSNTTQFGFKHHLSLYRHNSGAFVFGAGTMQWSWGLDANHDLGDNLPSIDMQQATVNFFKDLGQSAATLQNDLIDPVMITETNAPLVTIISPVNGANVSGSFITIAGTSADVGGGAVSGVEVSSDGGISWNMASGTDNWSYSFTTTTPGIITVMVRAWDDRSNLGVPGPVGSSDCININITGPFSYSVFPSSLPSSPPIYNPSGGALELGMKFRSTVPGFITGVQYYKQTGSTGTRVGHLWTTSGTLLSEVIFTNETSSGWQKASFLQPVEIEANTTYVVSYFSPNGAFIVTSPYFTNPQVNGFLTGLANGFDGPNGLYIYSPVSAFPSQSVGSSNYWVDVLFAISDLTPPEVVTVLPADNSENVLLGYQPFVKFNEKINPATLSTATIKLKGPGNFNVAGSISITDSSATFIPSAPLALSTQYTLTLKGGITGSRIKDLSGNTLVEDFISVFTTQGLTSPVITLQPLNQTVCNNNQVTFSAAAEALPVPTVQWEVSSDSGNTWTSIPGATSYTLAFVVSPSDNNNLYRSVFSNSEGDSTSQSAGLSIISAASGTIGTFSSTICSGNLYQLQLTSALGQGPFSLIVNGTNYAGVNAGDIFASLPTYESLWNNTVVPANPSLPDPNSVELGIRFKSTTNGFIKGVKFYKGSGNNGVHIGSLWSSTGTQLATASFYDESESGWQEVIFSTPVPVTANTIYVASYFAPNGHYSRDTDYFLNGIYSNGSFLQTNPYSFTEPSGVYVYSATSAFPGLNPGPHNYWVDVIFSYPDNYVFTSNLTSITDNNGCTGSGTPMSTVTAVVNSVLNPTFVAAADSSVCLNTPITYTTQFGQSEYIWDVTGSNGIDFSIISGGTEDTSHSVTLIWLTPGEKTVNVNYSSGDCSGEDPASSVTIVNSVSQPFITGNTSICSGSSTILSTSSFANYLWSDGSTTNSISVDTSGTYAVTVTDVNGCTATSDTVTTTFNIAPTALLSGTTTICNGGSVNLSLNLTGTAPFTYAINNGSIINTSSTSILIPVNPSVTTSYTLTSFSDSSCSVIPGDTIKITVNNPLLTTAPAFQSPPLSACVGNTITLSVAAVNNATSYTWSGPAGTLVNGSAVPVITNIPSAAITFGAVATGSSGWNICVFASNACNSTVVKCQFIRGILSTPAAITGNKVGCPNTSSTYSTNAVSGATQYVWSGTNGITFTGSGTSVQANFPAGFVSGNICVRAGLPCGYLSGQRCLAISNAIGSIGAMTGPAQLCPGQQNVTYSVPALTAAVSYTWTIPSTTTIVSGQGTNSLILNVGANYTGGSICVTAASSCGINTLARCKTLSSLKPPTPANISGAALGVCGQTITYSVPLVTGATSYTWTLPAGATLSGSNGSNTVMVSFSNSFVTGQLCVTANNSCTSSNARCITLKGAPNKPASISGPGSVCNNQAGITYSITPVFAAATYTWGVPSGASIISGQGSPTATINWGTTAGNVTVKAGNTCGLSGTTTLAVTINCRFSQEQSLQDDINVYPNPVSNYLNIEYVSDSNEKAIIRIIDASGKVVRLLENKSVKGLNNLVIDVSKFKSGLYLLIINGENSVSKSRRFIIN